LARVLHLKYRQLRPSSEESIELPAPQTSPRSIGHDRLLYRILHAEHPRTGDALCAYPTYGLARLNRTLTLRDTWAKLQAQGRQDKA